MVTEEEYIRADKHYRAYARASDKAAEARARLPPGSTRAKVTTANARWARAAEARDERARYLRGEYQRRFCLGTPLCHGTTPSEHVPACPCFTPHAVEL